MSGVAVSLKKKRHTRCSRDWSSDVSSSDLRRRPGAVRPGGVHPPPPGRVDDGEGRDPDRRGPPDDARGDAPDPGTRRVRDPRGDRRSTGALDGQGAAAGPDVPGPENPPPPQTQKHTTPIQ